MTMARRETAARKERGERQADLKGARTGPKLTSLLLDQAAAAGRAVVAEGGEEGEDVAGEERLLPQPLVEQEQELRLKVVVRAMKMEGRNCHLCRLCLRLPSSSATVEDLVRRRIRT